MKRFGKLIGFLAQVIIACVWLQVHAEEGKITNLDSLLKELSRGRQVISTPFDLSFEPTPMPSGPGPANLRVSISPNLCENVTITVTKIDKLEYSGDMSWSFHGVPEDTYSFELEVVVPSNDTSGIEIEVKCDPWSEDVVAYFVTTMDKVEYYYYNPRLRFPSSKHKAPKKSIDYGHLSSVPGTVGDPGRGYVIDAEGNVFPAESLGIVDSIGKPFAEEQSTVPDRSKVMVKDQDGKWISVDTAWLFDSLRTAKIKAQREEMHKLEETPLTETSLQWFNIGDTVYVRRRGEYKFHVRETTTDPTGYTMRYRDSLRISQGKVFERIFDLRNPADYQYVSGLVDSLIPTDSAGFYRATIDWKTVLQCQEKGISFHKPGWKPFIKVPADSSQNDSSEKKKK
jgi:hypothetical protein